MDDNQITIVEQFTLPSKGLVYKTKVNPNISLRSMTTAEEMRRLQPSDRPMKVMCDIIDACMVDKPGISSYDMCLGDYQFLLHRLRMVTYGEDYKIHTQCPYCLSDINDTIKLGDLKVNEYTEEVQKYFELDLPRTKHHIKLRMQTPRMLDEIQVRAKEYNKQRSNKKGDSALLFNVQFLIETVDGETLDPIKKEEFVEELPMMDVNYILAYSDKFNGEVGLDMGLTMICDVCGLESAQTFREGQEFFRPTYDI